MLRLGPFLRDRFGWQAYLKPFAEKPISGDLNWTFTVLDDPVVNAMALPGGYIYINRGILAHFNSEAELASVLGHEIGHVTARHSVEQMSRAQLAQLGLGVAAIASEEFRQYAGLASQVRLHRDRGRITFVAQGRILAQVQAVIGRAPGVIFTFRVIVFSEIG